MEPQNSKKWVWIVLAIIVVAGAVWFFGRDWGVKETIEGNTAPIPEDSTTAIESDLNSIDTGDLEKEMQDVEQDINSL